MAAAELVAHCFAVRTAAHLSHLAERSYARHVALQELYQALPDAVDRYAEAYQGRFGIITSYPAMEPPSSEPELYLATLRTWLDDYREQCSRGKTELANLIDEIKAVIDTAVYKLRFLK